MSSKINFQILIATMYRENLDFLYAMFPHHNLNELDIILVNQTTPNSKLASDIPTVKVINSFENGLSKSRNLALEHATADWCLIADDDLIYLRCFEKDIQKGITLFSNSGLIIFQVELSKDELFRKYPENPVLQLNIFQKMSICSVEMLINRKNIDNKIVFNEFFGLGSQCFKSGEESVFINEIEVKTSRNISFYNEKIVQHLSLSTGKKPDRFKLYYSKGAVFNQIAPKSFYLWVLIQLFFDIKQRRIKINTIFKAYKKMLKGGRDLRKLQE